MYDRNFKLFFSCMMNTQHSYAAWDHPEIIGNNKSTPAYCISKFLLRMRKLVEMVAWWES